MNHKADTHIRETPGFKRRPQHESCQSSSTSPNETLAVQAKHSSRFRIKQACVTRTLAYVRSTIKQSTGAATKPTNDALRSIDKKKPPAGKDKNSVPVCKSKFAAHRCGILSFAQNKQRPDLKIHLIESYWNARMKARLSYLHGLAKVVSSPFLLDDVLVDLSAQRHQSTSTQH